MPENDGPNRDEYGRFLPGTSGNPKGRPKKGHTLTDALRDFAYRRNMDEMEAREALAEVLWDLALNAKDVAAIRYIYDRLEGKPTEKVEHNGKMQWSIIRPADAPDDDDDESYD